jgi:hypothetical protein
VGIRHAYGMTRLRARIPGSDNRKVPWVTPKGKGKERERRRGGGGGAPIMLYAIRLNQLRGVLSSNGVSTMCNFNLVLVDFRKWTKICEMLVKAV